MARINAIAFNLRDTQGDAAPGFANNLEAG
jgi:hypothetical protein